jgi:hypothetical protein
MKYFAAVIIAILIFLGGSYFGYHQKKCDCACSTDTVFIPGDTFVFEKPKQTKTYPVIKGNLNTAVLSAADSADHLPDTGQLVSGPCDSIRVYEYSDSLFSVKDSVQGILLGQTIIKNPTILEIRTVRKDSIVLLLQRGFYLGGSAGLNSIRIEAELVDKKGWSYSAGYDLINKSPVLGIKRKLF